MWGCERAGRVMAAPGLQRCFVGSPMERVTWWRGEAQECVCVSVMLYRRTSGCIRPVCWWIKVQAEPPCVTHPTPAAGDCC